MGHGQQERWPRRVPVSVKGNFSHLLLPPKPFYSLKLFSWIWALPFLTWFVVRATRELYSDEDIRRGAGWNVREPSGLRITPGWKPSARPTGAGVWQIDDWLLKIKVLQALVVPPRWPSFHPLDATQSLIFCIPAAIAYIPFLGNIYYF